MAMVTFDHLVDKGNAIAMEVADGLSLQLGDP